MEAKRQRKFEGITMFLARPWRLGFSGKPAKEDLRGPARAHGDADDSQRVTPWDENRLFQSQCRRPFGPSADKLQFVPAPMSIFELGPCMGTSDRGNRDGAADSQPVRNHGSTPYFAGNEALSSASSQSNRVVLAGSRFKGLHCSINHSFRSGLL